MSVSPVALTIEAIEDQSYFRGPDMVLKGEVKTNAETLYLATLFSQNGLRAVTQGLTNPFTVGVYPKAPDSLGAGTYTDEVVIAACSDEACEHHFEGSPFKVPVTYTIKPVLQARLSTFHNTFSHTLGTRELPRFILHVTSPSRRVIPWTLSTEESWFQVSGRGGQTPSEVQVTLNPEGLAPGRHYGRLLLEDTAMGARVEDLIVTFDVSLPTLTLTCSAGGDICQRLSFGGEDGRSHAPQQVRFVLHPWVEDATWTAAVDVGAGPAWLNLSATSGTFSSTGASVTASVNPAGLPAGTHTGSVTFTAMVKGHPVKQTVPVSLTVDAHRLSVSDNGVALVSTPTVSHLTHTVRVQDNLGLKTTPWTATSNRDWLSVTASGLSGGALTLTANPAGLAPGVLHQATVSLSTGDTSVVNTESLQVALWVSESAPATQVVVPGAFHGVEPDPIRPLAYVHDNVHVHVYNVYTGERVATVSDVGSGSVRSALYTMAASSDGSTLYVLDYERERVVVINLATLGVTARWNLGLNAGSLEYARPDGVGVLLSGTGRAFDPTTGAAHPNVFPLNGGFTLGVSQDGSRVCSVGICNGGCCFRLVYTAVRGGSLERYQQPGSMGIPDGQYYSVALNHDGSRVYLGATLPPRFQVFQGENLTPNQSLATDAAPVGMEVGPDNRLYGFGGQTGPSDVWVYDNTGAPQGTFRLGSESAPVRKLAVSGDGKRMVVLTPEGVKFVTTP